MKKRLLLLVLIVLSTVVYAQVQRSGKLIAISGKKYYLHKVESGQTMFGVSKAYAVSINEILKANRKQATDLREGELLRIPYAQPSTVIQSLTYKHYIVKKGDTLYSLAKKFETTEEELIRLNAGVEVALVEGRRLIVPVLSENQPRYDSEYYYHIVKKGETLASIGRRYGMSLKKIKRSNRGLNPDRLSPGDEVRIPIAKARAEVAKIHRVNRKTMGQMEVFVDKDASEKRRGTLTKIPSSWKHTPYRHYEKEAEKGSANFELEEPTDYNADFAEEYKMLVFLPLKKSSMMVDYYKGMLLAMQENGDVPVDIQVFDSGSSKVKVRSVLQSRGDVDFIVGPYSKSVFSEALPYAKGNTMLVSLLSKNEEVYYNPNVLQLNTTEKTINHKIAEYLVNKNRTNNIILFDGKAFVKYQVLGIGSEEVQKLTNLLNTAQDKINLSKEEVEEQIKEQLSNSRKNIIVVPESNYKEVNKVLSSLSIFSRNNVEVVGYYKWKLLPNIDPEVLFNLNVTYFTPFHYLASEQSAFMNRYKERFQAFPNDFSYMGYETMCKILRGIKSGGRNFYQKPLQKIFKHKGGGYESIDLHKVQFQKNYKITAE